MNQHSKRVDEVRRRITHPVGVRAIVLCVGVAVAMIAISSCGKPSSHEETQTQPEAAVQTEIPTPEIAESETETPEPNAVSPVSVPQRSVSAESSTAAPVSQASPAADQLMNDHVNPPTPVEDDESYDFSHDLNEETVTFDAINPTTKVPGQMTVTITGPFRGKRLGDGQSGAGSHLKADQRATFVFNPNDRYSPSYSATVNTLNVAGDSTNDTISFDFGLETTGTDGSSQQFMLREVATITADGAHVTFSQLK
jgi:hypothetical protein